MNRLISDEIISSLEYQMLHEKNNAYIYLFISGYLKSRGMDKLSSIFEKQHSEEQGHFMMIFDFLTKLSVVPKIQEGGEEFSFDTLNLSDDIVSIANLYMEREIQTTKSLDSILELCESESNYVCAELVREMIKNQVSEYDEATDFLDKANICGENWMNVLIWNNSL